MFTVWSFFAAVITSWSIDSSCLY